MESQSRSANSSRKGFLKFAAHAFQVAVLFAVYFSTAKFGLSINAVNKFAALVWPPTGIALATLVLFGRKLWPGIFLGAFFVNYGIGAPLWTAVGIAVGNTLEALVGAWFCGDPSDFHPALDRPKDAFRLIGFGAILSTLISATLGSLILLLSQVISSSQFGSTWLQWWAGDAMGDLTAAPLLLVFGGAVSSLNRTRRNFTGRPHRVEAGVLLAVFLAVSLLVFYKNWLEVSQYFNAYFLFPILLWAALRFGQRGAVLFTCAASAITIWCTAHGFGPFAGGSFSVNLIHVFAFTLVISLTGLVVGAVITEWRMAKENAETANRAKSTFLANMSHEIRTPLGVVLGFAELLSNLKLNQSQRAECVEAIQRNGRLLSNIIDDILDLAKVEAGKIDVERQYTRIDALTVDLGIILSHEATRKGIHLVFETEGQLPVRIKTDALRVRQILLNVVGNAIKFTERGSVTVVASMMMVNGKAKLAFAVKDTGTGISEDQVQRLFSPFSQADPSVTRKFGGTGLGLALSKRLAQELGGDVILSETKLGVGSHFVITVDPGDGESTLASVNCGGEKSDRSIADRSIAGLKILLVEDSQDNQFLFRRALQLDGASVEVASDGREGLRLALDGDFDVVLMDLQMPGMDGYQATAQLRKAGFRKPIIALTAHAMKEEHQRCLEWGFDDHLSKPVDLDHLRNVIADLSIGA
ncbi:MAG: hypothetical protein C5B49_10495 [Bdellovibrio sp.]|nr:MAG: hypothetical protein C5B49_10495 [Bdellovibrio sp.]